MELLFTIVEAPAEANMQGQNKIFASGSDIKLGRATGNTWVLPDSERVISSHHASISFQNGLFILTDNSTNGTFLNDDPNPLGPSNPTALKNGDTIIIGPYLLQTTLVQSAPKLPDGLEAVDFLDLNQKPAPVSPPMAGQNAPLQNNLGQNNLAQNNLAQHTNEQVSPEPDDFDQWLEPKAQPSAQPWTNIDSASLPLDLEDSETDPLAALDKLGGLSPADDPSSSNNLWGDNVEKEDEGEWWKTSFSDHAAPDSHAMPQINLRVDQPVVAPPVVAPPVPEQVTQQPSITNRPVFPNKPEVTQKPLVTQRPSFDDITAPKRDDITAQKVTPPPPPVQTQPQTLAPQPPTTPQAPAPQPQAPVAPSSSAQDLARELGLNNLSPTQEAALLTESVAIVRDSIKSLMGLLSARASIKNELRVERTMIRPTENNPLKFSPNPEEALTAMFSTSSAAFISPSHAVQEGFEDISDHQIAVLVGMKTAFNAMLSHFDPNRLERHLNKNESRAILTSKKARLWDGFEAHFQALNKDMDSSYQELFGDAFAEAYENQLAKLKGMRRLK